MRLGPVDGVVDPSTTLLDADGAPLLLGQQPAFGDEFRHVRRQDDVPVLEDVVVVLLRVLNLLWRHCGGKRRREATDVRGRAVREERTD